MLKQLQNGMMFLNDIKYSAVCIALPAEMHYSFAKKSLLAG